MLGKEFSKPSIANGLAAFKELEDICFDFGIEVELTNVDEQGMRKETKEEEKKQEEAKKAEAAKGGKKKKKEEAKKIPEEEIIFKFEVSANRYDLLCVEGLAYAFRTYLGLQKPLKFTAKDTGSLEKIIVKPETKDVRPYVVGAILRGVTLSQAAYDSFIDLQDKLHSNICRRRTIGSMGTHDYSKIKGPITYEARKPDEIKFQALKQDTELNAVELFERLSQDNKLKKFLQII